MKLWQMAVALALGIVFGVVRPGQLSALLHDATLYIFLPALIFEAAWQLDFSLMRRGWLPIVVLAVPGVVATAALIAATAHGLGGLAIPAALILGAILDATDPVAVVAIFRRLDVPPLLATIVESESLLNDAIAVVLYRALVTGILLGATGGAVVTVAWHAVAGAVAGIAIGVAAAALFAFALDKRVPAAAQGITTFVAAYAAFYVAERSGASGILATIALAIGMREIVRARSSLAVVDGVDRAWSRAASVSNALLFFLIGAAVQFAHLWDERAVVLSTLAGVALARAALAYVLFAFATRLLRSWRPVVQLAGLRGALSLALALGIPPAIAERPAIVDATFVVVVVSIAVGTLAYERHIGAMDLSH